MAEGIHLNAELRSDSGKGASRRLRNQGLVPAIVYGGDRDPAMISIQHNEFVHELENEAIYTQVIELRVEDRKQDVILRDLQRHPYKNKIMHADFYRIDENKPININVPIHLVNVETCVGVKSDGGQLMQQTADVEIIALPKNLPEYLEIDVANLHLGDALHLTDIKLPEGVEIVALSQLDDVEDIEHDQHNISVVSVTVIREEEIFEDEEEDLEAAELEEGEEAAAEDEGEGEAPADDAGGEGDDKE